MMPLGVGDQLTVYAGVALLGLKLNPKFKPLLDKVITQIANDMRKDCISAVNRLENLFMIEKRDADLARKEILKITFPKEVKK